jgi:hypothetical protein
MTMAFDYKAKAAEMIEAIATAEPATRQAGINLPYVMLNIHELSAELAPFGLTITKPEHVAPDEFLRALLDEAKARGFEPDDDDSDEIRQMMQACVSGGAYIADPALPEEVDADNT